MPRCAVHGRHAGICHDCARARGEKMNRAEWRAGELEAALRLFLDLHDPPSAAIRRRHAEDERGWNMILSGAVRRGRVLVPQAPECAGCCGAGVIGDVDRALAGESPVVQCARCDGEGCDREAVPISDVERALWREIGAKLGWQAGPPREPGLWWVREPESRPNRQSGLSEPGAKWRLLGAIVVRVGPHGGRREPRWLEPVGRHARPWRDEWQVRPVLDSAWKGEP